MECKVVSARLLAEPLQCIGYPGDWWPVWMLSLPLGLIEMLPCLWPRWTDRLRIRGSIRRGHRLFNLESQGFFPSELHYQRSGQEGKNSRNARELEWGRDASTSSGECFSQIAKNCRPAGSEAIDRPPRSDQRRLRQQQLPPLPPPVNLQGLTSHNACKVLSDSLLLFCSSLTRAVLTSFYMDEDKDKGFKPQGDFPALILIGRL